MLDILEVLTSKKVTVWWWIPSREVRIGWMWGRWISMIRWSHPKPLIKGPPVNASLPIAFNRVSGIGKCFHWRIHWECKLLRPGLPNTACIQELALIYGLLFVTNTCGCHSVDRTTQATTMQDLSLILRFVKNQPCLNPKSFLRPTPMALTQRLSESSHVNWPLGQQPHAHTMPTWRFRWCVWM